MAASFVEGEIERVKCTLTPGFNFRASGCSSAVRRADAGYRARWPASWQPLWAIFDDFWRVEPWSGSNPTRIGGCGASDKCLFNNVVIFRRCVFILRFIISHRRTVFPCFDIAFIAFGAAFPGLRSLSVLAVFRQFDWSCIASQVFRFDTVFVAQFTGRS